MEEIEKEMEGFEARVFQHEMNHLTGNHIMDMSISEGEMEFIPQTDFEYPNFQEVIIRLD